MKFLQVFLNQKKCFIFKISDISPDIICLSKTLGGGKSSISLVIDNKTYDNLTEK